MRVFEEQIPKQSSLRSSFVETKVYFLLTLIAGGLDYVTFKGPFQSQLFYDSMNMLKFVTF